MDDQPCDVFGVGRILLFGDEVAESIQIDALRAPIGELDVDRGRRAVGHARGNGGNRRHADGQHGLAHQMVQERRLARAHAAEDRDFEALILERSGPEALASCYEDAAEDIPDEAIQQAIVVCPLCQYSLSELAPRGVCPECGTRYDKAELLTRRAGPL